MCMESPILSSEMSTSMWWDLIGAGLHLEAEHLLVDLPVGVADLHRVGPRVQRHFVTTGLLGSTTWKSMCDTVPFTGWRWISRP